MNLYELSDHAAYLHELLINGDIDEQTFSDSLEGMECDERIEECCKLVCQFKAEQIALKTEEQRLARKRKIAENGEARAKAVLLRFMQATDAKKLTPSGLFTVSRGKTARVNYTDMAAIPDEWKEPQPPKPKGREILAALKNNETIPGCEIAETEWVKIK